MGEFELLGKLRERLPAAVERVRLGSGDDAAVTVPGGATATSVDALVEGVHFRRGEAGAALVGRKALSTALSDLAAMGASAGEAYVVLGVPPEVGEEECLELLDGMLAVAAETGTTLAGGDLTAAAALTIAVTVVGHGPAPERFVTRGGGSEGDLLVLTGELGAAAAGRLLLEEPALGAGLAEETAARLRARQLDPSPRLRSGRALATAGARAMIDVSDGLGADAGHLAAACGLGAEIDAASLPLAKGVAEVAAAAGREPLELAASGGEDYELLAALPAERLGDASMAIGEAAEATLTPIGRLVGGGDVEIRLPGGASLRPAGFDHLAPERPRSR